jgi:hypothetical protein
VSPSSEDLATFYSRKEMVAVLDLAAIRQEKMTNSRSLRGIWLKTQKSHERFAS